ncbi:unnamed protein product [Closterium sp. NIES-53]
MEGGFRRDGNGELGKEDEGGRGKQWVRKGEKGRVKIRDNKGDMNVQEDEEGEEWDEEEGDEKEEGRSLDEAEEETDGENKQPHVSDDLELVLSDGQARGLQSGQGGEGDENAGRGNSGLELEGSRKLLQESAPCCDPLVLKLRVQTADLERRMGQIAEKQTADLERRMGQIAEKQLWVQTADLERRMGQIAEKQAESKRVSREKYVLNKKLSRADANWEALFLSNQSMHEAQMTVQRCNGHGIVAQQGTLVWKGYTCDAADEALRQYTTYDASGACPDDWFATQSLIFHHRCFSLPQRRCRARTTNQTIDVSPYNSSLKLKSTCVYALPPGANQSECSHRRGSSVEPPRLLLLRLPALLELPFLPTLLSASLPPAPLPTSLLLPFSLRLPSFPTSLLSAPALPPGTLQSERTDRHSPRMGPPRLLLLRVPQRPRCGGLPPLLQPHSLLLPLS